MLDIIFGAVVIAIGIVLKLIEAEAVLSVERVALLIGFGLVAGVIGKTQGMVGAMGAWRRVR